MFKIPARIAWDFTYRFLGAFSAARAQAQLSFIKDFLKFKYSSDGERRFSLLWRDRFPCLNDRSSTTVFDRHYIYHPAWAARVLAQTKPSIHIDISSSLHFCSLVSAFIPIDFYDYRPAKLRLSGLSSQAGDLLALPFENNSILSLSCMHVVEHLGLGRYGDQLDPNGDLKAIAELTRVLGNGGTLLFVVPIGKPRVIFNAHRIYAYEQVIEYFSTLELKEFALIPDDDADGGLIYGAPEGLADKQAYGCGCFWFVKTS